MRADQIIRSCQHERKSCEVNMGRGEIVNACADCWNASVYARRAERKQQLAEHWANYRAEQSAAMASVGAAVGDRVRYFAPSMLGPAFGGLTLTGRIVANRNGVAVVKLDEKYNGKSQTEWNKGWKSFEKAVA